MRSLSGAEKDTAGPCAPSRRVVSYMTIFLADIKKPPDLLGGRSTDISGARYVGGPPRLISMAVPAVTEADLLGISFAFGFIITALVYAIGKVSGCHINPAVTFALAVTKRFPWREVPIYWVAQYVGAVIGAFAIWGVFGANAVTFGMGQTHLAADAPSSYL